MPAPKNHNKSKNCKKSGVISLTKHPGWLHWDLFLVLNKEPSIADLLEPKICLISKSWSLGKLSRIANSFPHRHWRKVRSCRPQTITKVDPLGLVSQLEQETDHCRSFGTKNLSQIPSYGSLGKTFKNCKQFFQPTLTKIQELSALLITKADSIGVCKPIPCPMSKFLIFGNDFQELQTVFPANGDGDFGAVSLFDRRVSHHWSVSPGVAALPAWYKSWFWENFQESQTILAHRRRQTKKKFWVAQILHSFRAFSLVWDSVHLEYNWFCATWVDANRIT